MATKAFHEIMSTRFWDFYPESLQNYRKTLFENIALHRPFVKDEERNDRPFFLTAKTAFAEKTYVGSCDGIAYWNELDPEDRIIAVIDVQGPILRNGDLCSYGSKEHRDLIMKAADDDRVIGFLVEVNSPGGSSAAKYDYEQAIDYARSKGKVIVGHIDGMACSAGYALMALCDEIYYTNPHDVVGCIGTMCAMYTQRDGDVNTVTQERYAEFYADGSPYKNKEFRDAAEGNYEAMRQELNKSCADFQKLVKDRRSNVTDEQLQGYTYEAAEVEGSLVDGQGSFDFCVSRIQELAGEGGNGDSASGNGETGSNASGDTGKTEEKQPEATLDATPEVVPATDNQQTTQTKQQTTMAKTYLNIQSAAGVNALVVDENGGFYMVEEMADHMEEFCAKASQSEATLTAKLKEVSELNALIEKERKEHAEALANLQVQHDAAVKALKDSHEKAIKESEDKLADAQKQIEAKETELKELAEAATQSPAPQDPPKDNHLEGGQEYEGFHVKSVCGEKMTWAQKAEARKKRDEELKRAGV